MFITVYLWIVKISERKLIVVGAVLSIVPISVTFYFALFWDTNLSVNTGYLLLIAVLVSKGQIVSFSLFCSLLSKLTPLENSSFYQSLAITTVHLSFIFSRLIASGVASLKIKSRYICKCQSTIIVHFFRGCLHESGLSFNPDRSHSVSVEIIED